jgi:hypothetical protein
MMLSVDSVVYQGRYVCCCGNRSIETRAMMAVARVSALRMNRMARRRRRGVGMKAMGRIMMMIVLSVSKESVTVVGLRYDVHCAVGV